MTVGCQGNDSEREFYCYAMASKVKNGERAATI